MESHDGSSAPVGVTETQRSSSVARDDAVPTVVERIRVATCLLVLWAVAFAQEPGKIVADTKIDLALNPLGLMARSLHLWDPDATFGLLQNQAYGYLFPMGPFAALGNTILPAWITQRLWWGLLLSIGYLSMRRLLAAMDVGEPSTRHLASLAFALSPRVLSTLGTISSEAAPALLVPAVLLPLVLASRGKLGARRGAALSGVALLGCGGVNATATLVAMVPAGLWLLTRSRWWRAPLTFWWSAAVICACSWWALPLVMLGKYSPPFLDWIESSAAVTRNITLLDVVRGTSHWIGHLVTSAGPWWNAGYELVSQPTLIVATGVVAGLGLAGLAGRRLPERTFLMVTLLVGVLGVALPHIGAFSSPLAPQLQVLLDGPLAAFRNVHKADPILRLAVSVGLAHTLAGLRRALLAGGSRWRSVGFTVAMSAAVVAVLCAALPGLSGQLPSRGSFAKVPDAWSEAGQWLDRHDDGGKALIVPASNFGEYTWGRPLDEVLRSKTNSALVVRDAVPLTPANTTRLLDSVESRLQTGRDLGGAVDVLRRSGVRFLVLRNDLDTAATGGVDVQIVRASLLATPSMKLLQGFGALGVNVTGQRVRPVEIWGVPGVSAGQAQLSPLSSVVSASGASENLANLADMGMLKGPVIFDGDAKAQAAAVSQSVQRVVTDGFRSRDRAFGAVRGRDVSQTLTADESAAAKDYLPWGDVSLRTTVSYDGLTDLNASSSLAQASGPAGLYPAFRPFAAVDGDSTTAWVAYADGTPTLTLRFPGRRAVGGLELSAYADRGRFGELLGIPTWVRVQTEHGSVSSRLSGTGTAAVVAVPEGPTSWLSIQILATDRGSAALVTGIASLRLPGLMVRETAVVPSASLHRPIGAYVLSRADGAQDGCIKVADRFRCFSSGRDPEDVVSLDRAVPVAAGGGFYSASGTLMASPGPAIEDLLDADNPVKVTASSRRSRAPEGRPAVVLDGDPATAWSPSANDTQPTLVLAFASPVTVSRLTLDLRDEWLDGREPTAQVSVDGRSQLALVRADGSVTIPPLRGKVVTIRLLLGATDPEGAASLEVAGLSIEGVRQAAPGVKLSAGCGSGPRLLVDGVAIPTKVHGARSAAYGMSKLDWSACAPLELRGSAGRVVVEQWRGFVPDRMLLQAAVGRSTTEGKRTLTTTASGPGSLRLDVSGGSASIVSLTQNANPGWRATLGGKALPSVVVDGWRQGFILPQGKGGSVVVEFGPERMYRTGLLAGLLLALALVAAAIAGSSGRTSLRAACAPRWAGAAAAMGVAVLLAGAAGALVGLGALSLAWLLRGWSAVRAGVSAALFIGAAGAQALISPGSVGGSRLEGSVRLACLAAVALVSAAGSFDGEPTSSAGSSGGEPTP